MAQIIIDVSQRRAGGDPKINLGYRLRHDENSATVNLLRRVMLSLADSWHLGEVRIPPEEREIERIVRVAGRKVEEAAKDEGRTAP